jgi:protein-tyrosine phosphatase
VAGPVNLRDLGGYNTGAGTTRRGLLLRSDAPVGLDEAGLEALRRLNIRTAIDLREPVERDLDPAEFDGLGIEVRPWPIVDGGIDLHTLQDLPHFYRQILDTRGERLAGAIRLLSSADALPAVVFCSAGKDRTGLVSALTLSALGVGDSDVADEYALTEANMHGEFRRKVEARAIAAGLSEQALAAKLGAPAGLMLELLAELRETHGGAAKYLAAHGLREDELDSLRRVLVAPAQQ